MSIYRIIIKTAILSKTRMVILVITFSEKKNELDLKIWKKFYRDLSKLYHPDNGGTAEDFNALQKFAKDLKEIFLGDNFPFGCRK